MTPLLPNPDYYIANLITMTSSEATRLWRRAIKESLTVHVFIVEKLMITMTLLSITSILVLKVVKQYLVTAYQPALNVIRVKEANHGTNGC